MLQYGMTFEVEDIEAMMPYLHKYWETTVAKAHQELHATQAKLEAAEAKQKAAEAKLEAAEAKLEAAYALWPSWRPP